MGEFAAWQRRRQAPGDGDPATQRCLCGRFPLFRGRIASSSLRDLTSQDPTQKVGGSECFNSLLIFKPRPSPCRAITFSVPKLVIQIPCFNEEDTLGITLAQLPKSLPGIDQVEWLIIDDGSIDATVRVAREGGVHHIIQRPHQGLSRAFLAGLEAAVEHGADIIVNLDADNQYDARDIPSLIRPILEGSADLVIGARPVSQIEHFSFWKKLLQRLGSWVVRTISRTDTPDAPSGFRALSREAAMRTHVFNQYTYTLETVIQAGLDGMAIVSVPIRVNQELRPSRLVKSVPEYIRH